MKIDRELDSLRETIKGRMSEHRYLHTLGVEKVACEIGKYVLPDEIHLLRCAALLHDIAKELPDNELISLINSCFELNEEDLSTVGALHSFAAVPLILRDFADYAEGQILDAVFHHTLGDENMSVFSQIIFVADLIEEGRAYEGCKEIRLWLLSKLASAKTKEDSFNILRSAVVKCINLTIESLKRRGLSINSRTLKTKASFEGLID